MSLLLFSLYTFVFLLTEFTVNVRADAVVGSRYVAAVYSAGLVFTAAGYFSFYLSRKLIKSDMARRLLISVFALLYMLTTVCFMYVRDVCLLLVFSASALFVGKSATNILYLLAIYLFAGFYVIYLTVTFMSAAPMTKAPELVAGMGRIIRSTATGAVALLSNRLFDIAGQTGVAIIGVCFSVAALVLFALNGDLDFGIKTPEPTVDRKAEFLCSFSLTPRKTEVFEKLIDAETTNKEITAELYISTRVVERYIASIYEKTGVKSRVALIKLYYTK